MSVDILLLAAGKSSRFNGIKQLADFDGELLINYVINNFAVMPFNTLYLALGANADKILPELRINLNTKLIAKLSPITCNNWSLGMGNTISDAVSYIDEQKQKQKQSPNQSLTQSTPQLANQATGNKLVSQSRALLITLADQPLIPSSHYQALYKKHLAHPEKIITTQAVGKLMAPVIFPSRYFSQLTKLSGHKGAQLLINLYSQETLSVQCDQAMADIDTVDDLQTRLLALNKRSKHEVNH